MANILVAYNVDSTLVSHFNYVQEWQARLFEDIQQYNRIVVSDIPIDKCRITNVVCERFGSAESNNVSAARNKAIEYANENNFDYVLLMDVDSVLLEPINVDDNYENTFLMTKTFSSTEEEIKSGTFDYNDNTRWNDKALFILPRSTFHLRFCEDFIGYFGEDIDFYNNVLRPAGFKQGSLFTRVLHVWHPPRLHNTPIPFANKMLLAKRTEYCLGDKWCHTSEWKDQELAGMVKAIHHIRLNDMFISGKTRGVLLCYTMTKEILPRFDAVQNAQEKIFKDAESYDRIIVSNERLDVKGFEPVVCNRTVPGHPWSQAMLLNCGIDYAREKGYSHIALFDSDTVLLHHITLEPGIHYITNTFHTDSYEAETLEFDFSKREKWYPGSIIVPRQYFNLHFCEDYPGIGSIDMDYLYCTLRRLNIPVMYNCIKTIHIWHERRSDPHALDSNMLLAKRLAQSWGDNWRELRKHIEGELLGMVAAIHYFSYHKDLNETSQNRR